MSLELVEPPTLPEALTLALGLVTKMSPLIILPPALTGVLLEPLVARMLPLSGLGWPSRRELPPAETVPWVAWAAVAVLWRAVTQGEARVWCWWGCRSMRATRRLASVAVRLLRPNGLSCNFSVLLSLMSTKLL